MVDQEQQQKAREQIEAVYNDGKAEINGRDYVFGQMTHKERRKVFAFFTKVGHDVQKENFWWMESPEFEQVEEVIYRHVLFNGEKLSNLDKHWDNYPQDYLLFIQTALAVISFPFMSAAHTS